MQNTIDFNEAYRRLEDCLNNYLRTKTKGQWVEKLQAFQKNELPIILRSRSLQVLKEHTQTFCNSLRSPMNKISMGLLGGSTLKGNIENLLATIVVELSSEPEESEPEPDSVIRARRNIKAYVSASAAGELSTAVSDEHSPSLFLPIIHNSVSSSESSSVSQKMARAMGFGVGRPIIVPSIMAVPCICSAPATRTYARQLALHFSPKTTSKPLEPIESTADNPHPIQWGFKIKNKTSNTGV